jgi:hypothetical protein
MCSGLDKVARVSGGGPLQRHLGGQGRATQVEEWSRCSTWGNNLQKTMFKVAGAKGVHWGLSDNLHD